MNENKLNVYTNSSFNSFCSVVVAKSKKDAADILRAYLGVDYPERLIDESQFEDISTDKPSAIVLRMNPPLMDDGR